VSRRSDAIELQTAPGFSPRTESGAVRAALMTRGQDVVNITTERAEVTLAALGVRSGSPPFAHSS
jgi:hypothetical protein